ncbi:unnamed protein product, partial [marine sediment metagenome]
VTIPITTAISLGTGYDLYSKLTDIPGPDLYDYKDNIIEIVEVPPVKAPPEVETLPATEIIHDSGIVWGQLIDTGYWNVVDCRFEWGETTAYGHKTSIVRMYEGNEGDRFNAELTGLQADTTYHYRAQAVTVGVDGELKGYGSDRTFTTEKKVVKGFTMRVTNWPANAAMWNAWCEDGAGLPRIEEGPVLLSYIWEWTKPAPTSKCRLSIYAFGPWVDHNYAPTVQSDEFDVRLRNGKHYVWDFGRHELIEEAWAGRVR